MRLSDLRFPALISAAFLTALSVPMMAQNSLGLVAGREMAHRSPEWASIERHLPDPATAPTVELEQQADILRARRFPEDALEFYGYALKRGGDPVRLYKKMGVTHLELRNTVLAEMYFRKAVKLDKKDAEAWNNLGAVEYMGHQYGSAIGDYKRSVKLQKSSAIYHSNLGMAYFDQRDYKRARKEISTALKLDPKLFEPKSSNTGISAHVLSPEDRARFCLEMAKTYAQTGNEAEMLHALSVASENGLDLLAEMGKDKILAGFRDDPRVLIIVQNQKALRSGSPGLMQVGAVQSLAPAAN